MFHLTIFLKAFADRRIKKRLQMTAICLFALFFFVDSYSQQFDREGPIDKVIIDAVVEVENSVNARGTGFLVGAGTRTFLITNKHVIGLWSMIDTFACLDSIFVTLYSGRNNLYTPEKVKVLTGNKGQPLPTVIVHPNSKIDIAVIDITETIKGVDMAYTTIIDSAMLVPLKQVSTYVTYGTGVFAIGFPGGVKSYHTNQPLVKTGYVASAVDGSLVLNENWANDRKQERWVLTEGGIFVVDGLIIPGNSGGPVVTSQEVNWFQIDGKLQRSTTDQNLIIGIVSHSLGNTGLTVVYSCDHILETIRMFMKK